MRHGECSLNFTKNDAKERWRSDTHGAVRMRWTERRQAMRRVRVVHYVNQFFAGLGGEEKADVGPGSAPEPVGPAIGLARALGEAGEIVGTVWCGDNYMSSGEAGAGMEVASLIGRFSPDVVVAGPAFASGRYGLACAEVCVAVQEQLHLPSVTAMHDEAPAVEDYRGRVVIVPCAERALGMGAALPVLARLAVKLGRGEELGPAAEEGYLPQGARKNTFSPASGAARAVAMLIARCRSEGITTELPLPKYHRVTPPASLARETVPRVALVAEGGLVPKGNPERMPSGWCRMWSKYDVSGISDLTADKFEVIHGGYDTTAGNADPDRIIPLDVLRGLEKEGVVHVVDVLYATCGNHGSISEMQRMGREIAAEMLDMKVDAAIVGGT
jgi:glycine reductase complex component B subunit gamma